ncbi:protein phosphatase 2C [Suhomyces tanzawaensis NRRL Y-17324]|uniref:Protein phosphatase 2C n=1 Tax=Suhomyces tanzawaensis NRRL Y-17324 TaxID=984487 RepID=A0A1E4SLZ4_9ASCO|nr:protein phosphatase 2C [Suhomyces tanzawaensis NRRL Y-17324]ODV80427.1 protein phosphatase 2C [Suhomyces tanzawaensis NRRL Y-17324]
MAQPEEETTPKPHNQTTTSSDPFQGLSFKVGVAENKNTRYRNKMEDVHTYIANFAERVDWGYFAIFDGHAGKDTARWCGNNMHTLLEREIDLQEDQRNSNMTDHLYNSFVKADELIGKEGAGNSGSTAAVAVLRWETDDKVQDKEENGRPKDSKFDFTPGNNHRRMLYTSNVGDLRIILCRNGQPFRLSYDHKATDSNEINRIKETGGLIMKNRVNGVLAVTRSLGDSYMKDLVIGKPFTTSTEITKDDEFMILACDGVWDVLSDLKACQFVSSVLAATGEPQTAAKKLCQLAMDNSTTDNVTVMIVKFDKGVFDQTEA